ncbi:MAG: TonB-dependent receptor family protein [Lautropia sp.]
MDSMTRRTARPLAGLPIALACACAGVLDARAQDAPADGERLLAPIVVTGTGAASERWRGTASIDVVDGSEAREGQLQVNLSESLQRVPGLVIRNRENYAQDLQLSVRGFGARSTFGVRGLRLYVDGIPATGPDGQGQAAGFPLGSADAIEVVRGPLSVLYGASSGGAILVTTQDGTGPGEWRVGGVLGSNGTWRLSTQASGRIGGNADAAPGAATAGDDTRGWFYGIDVGRFETDGFRAQSAAERDTANVKLTRVHDGGRTVLVFNHQTGFAQDPLGLSRAEFDADPYATTPVARQFDTRKSVSQRQVGVAWEQALGGGHRVELIGYGGEREVVQYLAIPPGAQVPAGSGGGVVDLAREYWGLNARWRRDADFAGGRLTTSVGIASDRQTDERRGYENFVGTGADQVLGVLGRLRRDETNRARSLDPYLQAEWRSRAWSLTGGVRHTRIDYRSEDRYVVGSNGDDSGSLRYSATLPVVGVRHELRPDLQVFASIGRGFETPTLNEVAYRSGFAGFNTQLNAARSLSTEAGLRGRVRGGVWSAVIFDIRTDDEIVVLTNSGGRATFRNAGGTRRQGIELAGELARGPFTLSGALTLLDATYTDGFTTCTSSPCTTPTVPVAAGNRMPGLPREQLFSRLAWAPPALGGTPFAGTVFSVEARHLGRVAVDDLNSDFAGSHTLLGLGARFEQRAGRWTLREFVRVDNLTDRRYAGSVIVNDGNGRYFEPGAGRAYFAGIEISRRF